MQSQACYMKFLLWEYGFRFNIFFWSVLLILKMTSLVWIGKQNIHVLWIRGKRKVTNLVNRVNGKPLSYLFPRIIIWLQTPMASVRTLLKWSKVRRIPQSATVNFGEDSYKNVATWNVRSMYLAGKINNTIVDFTRLNISVLVICEIHSKFR